MKNLIFFDTETTGKEAEDRICQLAYAHYYVSGDDITLHEEVNELYTPPRKIGFEAMSVHHITNEMVEGKPTFTEHERYGHIEELFDDPDTIVVAHNAKFDLAMLAKEGVEPKNVICTLKIARHLDTEGKIPQYKLQYLRYLLGLNVEGTAHDALGDVHVLKALFDRLYTKVAEGYQIPFPLPEDYFKEMVRMSEQPVSIIKFAFGKHIGKKIADVAKIDSDYLRWLYKSESQKQDADEDMLYTLKKYV